jgi:transcriptional regulator with XRE-family HTH domain
MTFSLTEELKDKEYRDAFVAARVREGIAFQLRALRESNGWDQKTLANKMGKPSAQPMISRYESGDYGAYSASTLLELASVFDVGLLVEFAPFSELVKDDREMSSSKKLKVPTYAEEHKSGKLTEAEFFAIPVASGHLHDFTHSWFEGSTSISTPGYRSSGGVLDIFEIKATTTGVSRSEMKDAA